jgi:hypothetical protein
MGPAGKRWCYCTTFLRIITTPIYVKLMRRRPIEAPCVFISCVSEQALRYFRRNCSAPEAARSGLGLRAITFLGARPLALSQQYFVVLRRALRQD